MGACDGYAHGEPDADAEPWHSTLSGFSGYILPDYGSGHNEGYGYGDVHCDYHRDKHSHDRRDVRAHVHCDDGGNNGSDFCPYGGRRDLPSRLDRQ